VTTQTSGTTVSNGGTAADQDFAQRCSAPGVIRCFNFDTDTDFNKGSGGTQGAWGYNSGIIPPYQSNDYSNVTRDVAQKASGASSLRFTIPSNSGAGASGSWFGNFTTDLSYQVGEGQEVYIQWRQRFSSDFLTTQYQAIGGGLANGWKMSDISAGDQPACTPGSANSTNCPTTCWDFEIVTQNTYQTTAPQMYTNCAGPYPYRALYGTNAPSGVTWQNMVDCPYPRPLPFPPCIGLVADEWMTFQVHIKVGKWNTWSSTIELWIAREGQPSILTISCSPTTPNPHKCSNGIDGQAQNGWYLSNSNTNYKIGKVWLLPYHTNKDPSQITPTAYTWYDELIISQSRIPDPGSAGGGGSIQPPAAPTSLTLQ
jgi:hypothetical protein